MAFSAALKYVTLDPFLLTPPIEAGLPLKSALEVVPGTTVE